KGHIMGLIGESGCGKSTLVKSILQVMDHNAFVSGGDINYNGNSLINMPVVKRNRILWKEIAMIPQASMDSMNPVYPVVDAFIEVMTKKGDMSRKAAINRAGELFEIVGIDKLRLRNYPHQFSGGMKQRVAIALALALNPKVIIADEPVTALDVIVQHQILSLLKRLNTEMDLTVILSTHDISVVAQICHEIAVMYAGKIVEKGSASEVLKNPIHPYSIGLANAFPDLLRNDTLISIKGSVPDLSKHIQGCRFYNRCPFAIESCKTQEPQLVDVIGSRQAACHRSKEHDELQKYGREAETWEKMKI